MGLFKKKDADEQKIKNEIIQKYDVDENIIHLIDCNIIEPKSSLFGRTEDVITGIAILYSDYLLILKKSVWRKKDRGSKRILYNEITSLDHDTAGTFGVTHSIEISVAGSEKTVIRSFEGDKLTNFFNIFVDLVEKYKLKQNNTDVDSDKLISVELEKISNLYEKGLLTDEEFVAMKKKIIEK